MASASGSAIGGLTLGDRGRPLKNEKNQIFIEGVPGLESGGGEEMLGRGENIELRICGAKSFANGIDGRLSRKDFRDEIGEEV